MKAYDEMDEDEKKAFCAMAHRITDAIPVDSPMQHYMRPAQLVVWIKTWQRPLLNVHTEFEVDNDLFVDDAIRQAVTFLHNLVEIVQKGQRGELEEQFAGSSQLAEIEAQQQIAIRQLAGRSYRSVIEVLFIDLFREARTQGLL